MDMFFSVVIPLFNKEAHLPRSIGSVLAQTFVDFELLVIDDGSTDKSAEIACSYPDSRIRVIRQTNGGVSAARNRGITEARGKWIAFLDADDEWLPQFLEKVSECAAKFPQAGAIYSMMVYIRGGRPTKPAAKIGVESALVNVLSLGAYNDGPDMNSSNIAIRADVFKIAGIFPEGIKQAEDLDMWLRVACTTEVAHIPEVLSFYHIDDGDSAWQKCCDWEPCWVLTYKRWLQAGRIPNHLIRSAEAYHQRFLLARSLRLAFDGRRLVALSSLFKDIRLRSVPKVRCFKALCWICLPVGLVQKLKKLGR